MNEKVKEVLKNGYVQLALTFVAGLVIGALFYPSRTIVKEVKIEDTTRIEKLQHEKDSMELNHKEQINAMQEAMRNTQHEYTQQIDKLTSQIRTLKSKSKTSYYKIVKPDGTVEIRKETSNDTEESEQLAQTYKQQYEEKLKEVETKWQTISEQKVEQVKQVYEEKIKSLEIEHHDEDRYSKEEINKRSTGFEVGYLSSKNYCLHVDRDVFGPVYFGVHGEMGPAGSAAGAGFGMRW